MNLQEYIAAVQEKFHSSRIIAKFEIVDKRVFLNRGYLRARLTLTNNDFLEIAESFAVEEKGLITLDCRYQWMNSANDVLKKRWDSVKHFPKLANFPHHVHVGSESNVEPGQSRNILELMELIESTFE